MTAQGLNRHWLSFELSQQYVADSVFRFAKNDEEAKQLYEEILSGKDVEI